MKQKFCRECLDQRTAVKAVWLAYLWGRWDILSRLGIRRKDAEPIFEKFKDANVLGDGGRLKSIRQVYALLRAYPRVVDASAKLVGLYLIAMSSEIPAIDREYERKTNDLSR